MQGQVFLKIGKLGGGKGSYFSFLTRFIIFTFRNYFNPCKIVLCIWRKIIFNCHIVLWKKDSLFKHELVKFDKWTGKITLLIFVQTCWLWNRKVGKSVCWIREGVGCMRLGGTVWNTFKEVGTEKRGGETKIFKMGGKLGEGVGIGEKECLKPICKLWQPEASAVKMPYVPEMSWPLCLLQL